MNQHKYYHDILQCFHVGLVSSITNYHWKWQDKIKKSMWCTYSNFYFSRNLRFYFQHAFWAFTQWIYEYMLCNIECQNNIYSCKFAKYVLQIFVLDRIFFLFWLNKNSFELIFTVSSKSNFILNVPPLNFHAIVRIFMPSSG